MHCDRIPMTWINLHAISFDNRCTTPTTAVTKTAALTTAWRQWHMQRLAFIDFCCEFVLQLFFPWCCVSSVFEVFVSLFFYSISFTRCAIKMLMLKRLKKNHREQMENNTQTHTHPFDLDFNERVKWIYTWKQNAKWNEKINCTPFRLFDVCSFHQSMIPIISIRCETKSGVICSTSICY